MKLPINQQDLDLNILYMTQTSMRHLSSGCNKSVRDWTSRDHKRYRESLTGLETCKAFPTRTLDQKNYGTNKTKQEPAEPYDGLFIEQSLLKGHLYRLGPSNDPICIW